MKIGILHEGRLDLKSSKIIITRIIGEEVIFQPYSANGQIVTKMAAALALFKAEGVDFAVFIGDIDSFPERKTKIREFINAHGEMKIIPAFCDPHFEEWYIVENSSVVQVLGVDPNYPFKSDSQRNNPKELINRLISEKSKKVGEALFEAEIYPEIASSLNLTSLARNDSNFKQLKEDLENYMKNRTN
jgi:hypothetical protein